MAYSQFTLDYPMAGGRQVCFYEEMWNFVLCNVCLMVFQDYGNYVFYKELVFREDSRFSDY